MGDRPCWSSLIYSFVAQQVGSIATNWWIRNLSNAYLRSIEPASKNHSFDVFSTSCKASGPQRQDVDIRYYFRICALFISMYLLISLLRMLLVSFGSLMFSAQIHQRLLSSIMHATFHFFDCTSFGQIINRFSRDLRTVDRGLAAMTLATLHFLGSLAGTTLLIAITIPGFFGPGDLISVIEYFIGMISTSASPQCRGCICSLFAGIFAISSIGKPSAGAIWTELVLCHRILRDLAMAGSISYGKSAEHDLVRRTIVFLCIIPYSNLFHRLERVRITSRFHRKRQQLSRMVELPNVGPGKELLNIAMSPLVILPKTPASLTTLPCTSVH